MSDDSQTVGEQQPPEECPECGGDLTTAGGTTRYTYHSCVKCEWYEKFKTGRYLP